MAGSLAPPPALPEALGRRSGPCSPWLSFKRRALGSRCNLGARAASGAPALLSDSSAPPRRHPALTNPRSLVSPSLTCSPRSPVPPPHLYPPRSPLPLFARPPAHPSPLLTFSLRPPRAPRTGTVDVVLGAGPLRHAGPLGGLQGVHPHGQSAYPPGESFSAKATGKEDNRIRGP